MRSNSPLPFVIGGLILALLLIVLSTRQIAPGNPVLRQQFAPRPTDPNVPTPTPFRMPDISAELQERLTTLQQQLASGQTTPALTPIASSVRVQVEAQELNRHGDRVHIRGVITNLTSQPLLIPPDSFRFRDSIGTPYTVAGGSGSVIGPQQASAFDLNLPLPPDRGLTMIFALPPDPPIEQILFVAP